MSKSAQLSPTVDQAVNTAKKTAKTVAKTSIAARITLTLVGIVQFAFAFLAFWDLAFRDSRDVRGPKPAWIPVILVNWIGPAAYFLFGTKR